MRRLALRSLQARLLVTYLVLTVPALAGLILWTGQRLHQAVMEQATQGLTLQGHLIADAVQGPLEDWSERRGAPPRALEGLARSYAQTLSGRVTLLDARSQVIVSSDERTPVGAEIREVELLAAREGRPQPVIRGDAASGEERLFVAVSVSEEGRRLLGFVQLSVPTAPLYAEIGRTWVSLLGAGLAVLLATGLASLLLARQVAGPIRRLTSVSEELAGGELERRVIPAGPDEVRRLGLAFNRMAERLQAMLARQQAFVAHAAHELRSPLTGLRLRLEMLQAHGENDRELTRRYLGQMEREVDRLKDLVDHLLALSALDEGERPPDAPVDLSALLHELADELGPLARDAGLDLRLDVPPDLPPLLGNPEQLRVVVRNLLDNAVKYTPAGGTVSLEAEPENGGVEVRVADSGVGIPAEALPHVFDRFYRVDTARSDQRGGTGLGLALVRAIVEAHGGRVEVASQAGAGSVFTVHLPARRDGPS